MVKRFIEWVEDFCCLYETHWQTLVGAIIGVFAAIIFGIGGFNYTDRVPATADDYAPLEQQIVAIQEKTNLLFSTDCDINVKDNVTTITLENSECKLAVKLDPTFNVLDTEHKDKSYTFWMAIGFALLVGVIMGVITGIATWLALWILYFLVWGVKQIYRRIRG